MTDAAVAVAGAWTTDPSRLPDELSSTFRAVMGWGGVAVWDESVDIVDLTREFAARTVQECCGQCFPCRIGMHEVADILEEICEGKGTEARLARALELSQHVAEASRCDLGRTGGYAVLESLEQHYDAFAAAVAAKQPVPRGEYAATVVAPCMAACPAGVDIPAYVEQLRIDEVERSAEAVRRRCPMPATIGRVCVRPCEDACRRGSVDEPVAIRTLKRFVADSEADVTACPMPGKPRVAIIGAGPAGLACAYYLGLDGVISTIFEALPEAGGMAAVGIPDYRLPRDVLRAEVERVESLGVKIVYNFRFGVDATMEQLFEQGFEAVFVAVGAHQSARMGCEGEDAGYDGFMPGVEFLREIAFGKTPLTGKTMLVIGGGNVAMDCVRSARRIGFDDVKLLYRRTEAEMPADQVEIVEAKEEGVEMVTLVAPTKIDGRGRQGHRPRVPAHAARRARLVRPPPPRAGRGLRVRDPVRLHRPGHRPGLLASTSSCRATSRSASGRPSRSTRSPCSPPTRACSAAATATPGRAASSRPSPPAAAPRCPSTRSCRSATSPRRSRSGSSTRCSPSSATRRRRPSRSPAAPRSCAPWSCRRRSASSASTRSKAR